MSIIFIAAEAADTSFTGILNATFKKVASKVACLERRMNEIYSLRGGGTYNKPSYI